MTRREFIEAAFASVSILTHLHPKEVSPSYYFDWDRSPPYTDDPEWAGRLQTGLYNRVFCGGVDIPHATRYQTGPNGWVEQLLHNPDGSPKMETVDAWEDDRVMTEEEVRSHRWQQCRPGKLVLSENGLVRGVEKRFVTRRARKIHRGDVVYKYLAHEEWLALGPCTCKHKLVCGKCTVYLNDDGTPRVFTR